jgi:hypothetical protein
LAPPGVVVAPAAGAGLADWLTDGLSRCHRAGERWGLLRALALVGVEYVCYLNNSAKSICFWTQEANLIRKMI